MSKYRDSSSRTSSASRDSDSGVKPTRSQNRTEHTRRSVTSAGERTASEETGLSAPLRAAAGLGTAANGVPHSPQNFCPASTAAPHDGQLAARPAPHSRQNRPVVGFEVP